MGMVIPFQARHARASAGLKPKTDGSASFPKSARAAENVIKFSGGIIPLAFQLLTADMPTPAKEAATAFPPTALTTASTELSIGAEYSHFVIMSTVHNTAVDCGDGLGLKIPMPETKKSLGERLIATREALGLRPAELCRRIKCAPNRWSQYESGERKITLEIANRLCDEFGLTLDWIYRNDPSGLPRRLNIEGPKAA